jgi:hypothetical protein
VDECELRRVRCIDGVDQQCADTDADPCLEWSWDTPCPSGACLNEIGCSYSGDCPTDPVTYEVGPVADTGATCDVTTAGLFGDSTHLAGGAGDPITIDGQPVSSCVFVDFGTVCTPAQACQSAQAVASACGDTCGAVCTDCVEPFAGPAIVQVFGSPVNELKRFRYIGVRFMPTAEPATHGGCIGFTGINVRYMYLCRADCGDSAYNINVGDVTLNNPN